MAEICRKSKSGAGKAVSYTHLEHSILPVSVYMEGLYGLKDLCISIPTVVGQNGAEKILDIPLDNEEMEKLIKSTKELKAVLEAIEI